ncbi:KEOPS complex component [Halobacteriales archaeon SW_7_68_16]|nr:MAG: KEOPS complex component [Halobacteriales archaeon SW_7_68_16]
MRIVEGTIAVANTDAFVDELATIGTETGATVQAFDARYVVSRAHVVQAVELADRSIERSENIARDRGMEILCYAAGRRQIERALTMGVEGGATPVVVVASATPDGGGDVEGEDADGGRRDPPEDREAAAVDRLRDLVDPGETLGTATDPERVRSFFGIEPDEEAATDATLADLVLERVALLAVEK